MKQCWAVARYFQHKQKLPINIETVCKIPITASQIFGNNSWSFHECMWLRSSTGLKFIVSIILYVCGYVHSYTRKYGEDGCIYWHYFLEGVPACMFLFDGKVLFISSRCSYYVYSIKHILNMHLIFISIRIWGLISFMTIDSFQAICILFCSLLFICSVLSKQFKYPSHHCPKWWIVCPSSKTNTTSPMLILWFCFVFFCVFTGLSVLGL